MVSGVMKLPVKSRCKAFTHGAEKLGVTINYTCPFLIALCNQPKVEKKDPHEHGDGCGHGH